MKHGRKGRQCEDRNVFDYLSKESATFTPKEQWLKRYRESERGGTHTDVDTCTSGYLLYSPLYFILK